MERQQPPTPEYLVNRDPGDETDHVDYEQLPLGGDFVEPSEGTTQETERLIDLSA